MIRWGLVITGLVVIWVSVSAWMKLELMDDDPMVVTLPKACQLAQGRSSSYVTIAGTADVSQPIFPTGLVAPAFAARPSKDRQPLKAADLQQRQQIGKLVGCAVAATVDLDPQPLDLQEVRQIEDPRTQHATRFVQFKRLLAPVKGAVGDFFVLSPPWSVEAQSPAQAWLSQKQFNGRLVLLDDVPRNIPTLSESWGQIRSKMLQRNQAVPRHAMVILPDSIGEQQAAAATPDLRYLPVVDSQNTLFVELAAGQESTIRQGITGILTPHDGREFIGFSNVIGKPLPTRIGVIRPQTAAEYNRSMNLPIFLRISAGLASVGVGLWLVLRARKRKQQITEEVKTCQTILESEKLRPLAPTSEADQILALYRCLKG